jgi:hypothetical protein
MAGTNVPSPTFGATGFIAPQTSAILTGVQADISAAFGTALNFNLNTPQGQLATSETAIIANNDAIFVYYTQQVDPAYASGRMQDAIGRLYGLTRNPAEPTTLQVVCVGLQGVTIPVGATVQDTAGNVYTCTGVGTIPSGGSITLSFACITVGPIAVPTSNGVSIYQAIPGWDSVSVSSGTLGTNTEGRAAFEARRQDSVAGNSFGAIGSIIGAVAAVAGVTDYYGYDNGSTNPVTIAGVSIGANSIYVCVAGGSTSDIAQAILSKKGAGCAYTGSTIVTAYDSNPLYASPIPYTVKFQIPTPLQLLFTVQLVNSAIIPSNATALIQAELVAAVTGQSNAQPSPPKARIGTVVFAASYIAAINALGSWAQVASIQV